MINWDLSQDARILQYLQINQCDTPYQQTEKKNPTWSVQQMKKNFWKKFNTISDEKLPREWA